MTREDREKAIEILRADNISGYSVEDILSARDSAIKALEQEPTDKNFTKADIDAIVKAINAHWELIIDEIRAEIEQEIIPRNSDQYDLEVIWQNMGLRMALKVIDKYKAESEGE